MYTVKPQGREGDLPLRQRRRIELEDKAKVVASDWGTESLPFTVELNLLFKKDQGKTASMARGTVELNHLFKID